MRPLIPSIGHYVLLRGECFQVKDLVPKSLLDSQLPLHSVSLEALDPYSPQASLDIIWEREVNPIVLGFNPKPLSLAKLSHKPCTWQHFQAFLDALRWKNTTSIDDPCLLAPFFSNLEPHLYQLLPVFHALRMPKIRLFLADDVGLGKTIQAGLIIQELLARQRIRKVCIVCPAKLQAQWQNELRTHFSLEFSILDRAARQRTKRSHGPLANPWNHLSRVIVSLDFLKQEPRLHSFLSSIQSSPNNPTPRSWDLLIIDEAHHLTPNPNEITDRTRMARLMIPHFDHRIFISATPHNGHSQAFKSLLQLLDPIHFSTKKPLSHDLLHNIMIRRTKTQLRRLFPQLRFPTRRITPLFIDLNKSELSLHKALDTYLSTSRTLCPKPTTLLIATILKKRLLSSITAFRKSFLKHLSHLTHEPRKNTKQQLLDEAWFDAREKFDLEQASHNFNHPLLNPLRQTISQIIQGPPIPESRRLKLLELLSKQPLQDQHWLVFTEYQDTLDQLLETLQQHFPKIHILTLSGRTPLSQRTTILQHFSDPTHPSRILLATDAAGEGINIQRSCSRLLHYDIPWNPTRIEQRNGRIDRYGQPAPTVHCYHFVGRQREDQHLLNRLLHKVQKVRQDLGPVNPILSSQIQRLLFSDNPNQPLRIPQTPINTARRDLQRLTSDSPHLDTIKQQRSQCLEKWQVTPRRLHRLVDQALISLNFPPLNKTNDGWLIPQVPKSWRRPTKPTQDIRPQQLFPARLLDNALHLNHPLIQRAIDTLLQPPDLLGSTPIPCCFHSTKDSQPSLTVFLQLSWINALGAKIHEQHLSITAQIYPQSLRWLDTKVPLPKQFSKTLPKAPAHFLSFLEKARPHHERALRKRLLQLFEQEQGRALETLQTLRQQRKQTLTQSKQRLLDELSLQISALEQSANPQQKLLWPQQRLEQLQFESRLIEQKRISLQEQIRLLPQNLQLFHQLHSKQGIAIHTTAILYLIPKQ